MSAPGFPAAELPILGVRRALDLAGLLLCAHGSAAAPVRLEAAGPALAAMGRLRLPAGFCEAAPGEAAGAALFLFSLEAGAPLGDEPLALICLRNRLSHRAVRGGPALSLPAVVGRLRRAGYGLGRPHGVYPPGFLAATALSLAAGVRLPGLHFRLGDAAFRRASAAGWGAALLSPYVVLVAGRPRASLAGRGPGGLASGPAGHAAAELRAAPTDQQQPEAATVFWRGTKEETHAGSR